jgi:hypothetical protein
MTAIDALRTARDSSRPTTGHRLAYLGAAARRELGHEAVATELASSTNALADRDRDLRRISQAYTKRKRELDLGLKIIEGTNWIVLTALTGSAARATPRGVGGSVMLNGVKTVATLGLNKVEEMAREAAAQELRRNLKYQLDQYRQQQPDLVPALLAKQNDPAAFRAELEARLGPVYGSALDGLPDDEKASARDQVVQFYTREVATVLQDGLEALSTVQSLQAAQLAENQKNVAGLARTFVRFAEDTNSQLATLVETSGTLTQAVSDLEDRVGRTEEGVAFLQRYAFGRMTPSEQLAALRAGQVPGLGDEERSTLEKKIEAVQAREQLTATVTDFVNGAGHLVTIARNLGVSPKILAPVEQAVTIGSHAASAIKAFASGNVLGGLAAVSAIFGFGGPDVAAERHKEVMGALKSLYEQQGVISEKLDFLIEGQQRLMQGQHLIANAVKYLSEDVARNHVEVLSALGRLEEEVFYLASLILQAVDEEYSAAERFLYHPVHNHRVLDTSIGRYPSEDELAALFATYGTRTFKKAGDRLRDGVWDSINNRFHRWFLLRSRTSGEDGNADPMRAQAFIKDVYTPTYRLLVGSTAKETRSAHLSALLAPVQTVAAVRQKRRSLKDVWDARLYENTFEDLLGEPLAPVAVALHAELLLHFHVLYQLHNDQARRAYTIDELAESAPVVQHGYVALRRSLRLLDIAIAQQAMLGGDILLDVVASAVDAVKVTEPPPEATARFQAVLDLMAVNPMFAQNVLRYALAEDIERTSSYTAYEVALGTSDVASLRLTFGAPWPVRYNAVEVRKEGGPSEPVGWVMAVGNGVIPLPTVAELSSGLLLFPAAVERLSELRSRVIDEIADYEVSAELATGGRAGFNRFVLATALGTRPND